MVIHAAVTGGGHKNGREFLTGKAFVFDKGKAWSWGAITSRMFQIWSDEVYVIECTWHASPQLAKLAAEQNALAEETTIVRLTPAMMA